MNPEDQLRRLRSDDRWHDTALQPRPTIASRPNRAWRAVGGLAGVGVVIAAGVLAANLLVPHGLTEATPASSPTATSTIVPWAAIAPTSVGITAGDVHPEAPPCNPADLTISFHPSGTTMGQIEAPLTIVNSSDTACLLTKPLALETLRSGTRQAVSTLALSKLGTGTNSVLLPSAVKLELHVHAAAAGNDLVQRPYTAPTWLRMNGTEIKLPGHLAPNTVDSVALSAPESTANGPYTKLRANLTFPKQVNPGSVLRYTVTLTNTGDTTLTFADACPTYTEIFNTFTREPAHVEHTYALNCQARSISAGASLTFAMQIDVPGTASGQYRAGWFLNSRNAPSDATIGTVATD